MTELKCPICNIPLERVGDLFQCPNDHCGYVGNKELWDAFIVEYSEHELCHDCMVKRTEELAETKKKLDIAIGALKYIGYDENNELDGLEEFAIAQMIEKAQEALEQISKKE